MAKQIFGITDTNEHVELSFKRFLVLTDNDSKLEVEILDKESQHPEKPDLALHIKHGPLVKLKTAEASASLSEESYLFKPIEGARYFSVIPGGGNLMYVKVMRKEP